MTTLIIVTSILAPIVIFLSIFLYKQYMGMGCGFTKCENKKDNH
jgi:hypothetical protein